MVRIEDKVGEWNGELKFSVEDETEFCLKPKIKHKRKLMFLERKFIAEKYEEKDLEEQDLTILDIIKEAYPDFTPEQVEGILSEYGTEILMELYIAWKWRDRKTIDAFKKKQEQEIDKLLSEDDQSTQT
jgi:hypothetical protein